MNEYEVTIYYTQYGSQRITVEAENEEDAYEEAYEAEQNYDIDWNDIDETDTDIECTQYDINEDSGDNEYNLHGSGGALAQWGAKGRNREPIKPSIED